MNPTTQPHNDRPGKIWSPGCATDDAISRHIASALDYCLCRFDPSPGERMLDLATGVGWTARSL